MVPSPLDACKIEHSKIKGTDTCPGHQNVHLSYDVFTTSNELQDMSLSEQFKC